MLALHAALVKGLFAEEGLSVQGMTTQVRSAVEQDKTHPLWVKTDTGLTEADFGYLEMDLLPNMTAGKIDYYIVDGMNFGCQEVMVAPDSPLKSAADLKGKTIEMNPAWVAPFRPADGPFFVSQELKTAGLDPAKDVRRGLTPWDALPRLTDYVAEGFRTGKFDAIIVAEPAPLMLRDKQLARPLFTQTYQAPYNQEYCCLFGIKRAIVDSQSDKAARIVRAYRRAKQWVAQNPTQAVTASQAAGYYAPAAPVEPSANLVSSFGFDRQVDLEQMLERAFKERMEAGAIKTDKTPQELVRLHYRRIE
jgi:NitT/TauT family transport system substrate-binding protein